MGEVENCMKLHLGGHLSWYGPQKHSDLEIYLPEPVALSALLQDLGIPAGEVAIIAMNGTLVELQDARVQDSDRVELFPPVGGGSKHMR